MDRYTEYHGGKADEETKMDKITTEFAEHICDNLCRYPHMTDGKSLEIICSECKIGKFICDILNTYNEINNFDKTQTAKLLKQVQQLKERDTAKKPIKTADETGIRYTDSYRCPNCGGNFMGTGIADFCYHCGQRLDFGGLDEI